MEGGDRPDPLPLQREDHEPGGARDRTMRVLEVEPERRLAVRARSDEPEALEPPPGRDGREELADRAMTLISLRLRRHREPRVTREQIDDPVHVAALERLGKATHQLPLALPAPASWAASSESP
jgi:hypothetical protein